MTCRAGQVKSACYAKHGIICDTYKLAYRGGQIDRQTDRQTE